MCYTPPNRNLTGKLSFQEISLVAEANSEISVGQDGDQPQPVK